MPVLFYYMDLYERIQNLPKLQYLISTGDQDAIQELKELYNKALGKTMKRECSSCRIRAYQELVNLTQQKIIIMANQKHTFKNSEALVYFGHDWLTKDNITDELAQEMVDSNPANADLFHGDFTAKKAAEPKAKKAAEPVIEVPATTVIEPKAD